MHICFVVSGDLWAGAACQVSNLLSELVKEKENHYSAITFNPGRLTAELTDLGIPVLCLPEARLSPLELFFHIRRHFRENAVDIAHCHGHKEQVLSCFASLTCKKPMIIIRTLHGMPEPYDGVAGIRANLYGKLTDFCSSFLTHKVIVVSRDMQRQLRTQRWAPKIICVHNGINPEKLKVAVSPEKMRDSLEIAKDDFIIGTACRLVPIKRLDILLGAFAIVCRTYSNAILLICGDGPLRGTLERQCELLNMNERVRFLGHRDDVHDVMSTFNLFVMTSDHEGIPMVLLEALALGLRIVAPAVGGIPEVTNGHGAVLLNPLTEAVLAEQFAEAMKKSHSDAGNSSIQRQSAFHTAKQTAEETARVYKQFRRRD